MSSDIDIEILLRRMVLFLALAMLSACRPAPGMLYLEAEAFSETGGWVVDQQFVPGMGSPYLLAHGAGVPVADASTSVSLEGGRRWYVYVRTYNWTSPWADVDGPGAFCVSVDGETLPSVCGTIGCAWEWQYAGSFRASSDSVRIALHDLSGFDGRCDAVCLSPRRIRPSRIERPAPSEPAESRSYDLVVVGGGVSGMCAAVSAARLGCRVALVHDREVLGGNNSSEVRVHLGGEIELEPYPALGGTVKEWGHTKKGNAGPASNYEDEKKMAFVAAEAGVDLLAGYRAEAVDTAGGRILAVVARSVRGGDAVRLEAPLFADCTGDGTVGFLAGADYHYGREGQDVYGEPSAPLTSDSQVLGLSVQWNSRDAGAPVAFPDFCYGLSFNDESVRRVKKGEWTWETGMFSDMIYDAERIRDYALLVIYSNWAYLKNHASGAEEFANRQLNWVGYIAGKRESRRLIGDVVLTENDVVSGKVYPDASATASWSIDLHYPDPENERFFPGKTFLAVCEQTPVDYYPIPYRCLYSRNVGNLFMAGRDISVSHIALGTTRVMRTCAMEGEVVGMAASIAAREACSPREVYQSHLDELQALMRAGVGKPGLPNNQTFNKGHKAPVL